MKSLNVNSRLFCRFLLVVALVLSSLLFLIAQSQADTFFGPEVFTRDSGKPVTVMQQISTDGFQPPFILHLQNGDENGEHRVSSAKVLLNGSTLFGPSDFSQQVSGYYTQVELDNPSTLEVRLASKPGSMLTIWIEGTPTINPNVKIVGPEGGRFEFPNGVILDIPPGAVTEETEIEVTDVQCQQVDEILSAQEFDSHQLRCLGGFMGKPDGQEFLLPVTATVSVLPLEPGEIPIQIEVNLDEGKYYLAPTNLTYIGQEGVAEMEIQGFSDPTVAGYRADVVTPWSDQPPPCCNETPTPKDCCCYGKIYNLSDYSLLSGIKGDTECTIVGAMYDTKLLDCPKQPQSSSYSQETTPDCPEDLTCSINLTPPALDLFVCDTDQFHANVHCEYESGEPGLFDNVKFQPFWHSTDPLVASVNPRNGEVTGKRKGTAEVQAVWAVSNPRFTSAEAFVNVKSNFSSFSVSPPSAAVTVDKTVALTAEGVITDGTPLDPTKITWVSANPSIAFIEGSTTGETITVKGNEKGTVPIAASYKYRCEEVLVTAVINVDCPNNSMTIDAEQETIMVDQGTILTALLLDEQGNPLDASEVTWSSDSPSVQLSPQTGPQTAVKGMAPSTMPVPITATYDHGGCKAEATAYVTVECGDLAVTPNEGEIKHDEALTLSVDLLDNQGNPVNVDLSGVTWSSSNADVADMIPSEGPLTIVEGNKPGAAEITASYDQGVCGMRTASSMITVSGACPENYDVYDVGGSGGIAIVYEDSSGQLETLATESGVFELEGLDSGCDENGVLHVVYAVEYLSPDTPIATYHLYNDGSGWHREQLAGVSATNVSLTFDANYNWEIVYGEQIPGPYGLPTSGWYIMYYSSTSGEVTLATHPEECTTDPCCICYPDFEDLTSEREADGRLHIVYSLEWQSGLETYGIYR